MAALDPDRVRARIAAVDEHVRGENRHDLDALMAPFGAQARFDDEPWGDRREGPEAVRAYYGELLDALPDLVIDVRRRHAADEAVVLEVVIRGTHLGSWRGLPATGRRVEVPLCGVFEFDAENRLAGERVFYDRAAVLAQLGMFHEPVRGWGRIATVLSHPITMVRALLRPSRRSPSGPGPAA
jgi:steroid delta-isomerase-like uncharacterized protein